MRPSVCVYERVFLGGFFWPCFKIEKIEIYVNADRGVPEESTED